MDFVRSSLIWVLMVVVSPCLNFGTGRHRLAWGQAVESRIEVDLTDGTQVRGSLVEIGESSVEVEADAARREIPLTQLRSIRFSDSVASNSLPVPTVTLTDGSHFALRELTYDGQIASGWLAQTDNPVPADASSSAADKIEIQAASLDRIQLQTLNETQATQWRALSESRMTGDSIVLIRSAEALERLDVVIQSISADSVKFEFSGQTLDAPRSKLAGVCFFNLAEASTPLARLMAVVSDSAGNRWLAAQLAAPTGNPDILLTTRGGVKIHAPRSQLSEIDYSSGSLRFLADIEPLRLEVQDKYGVSSLVAGLADMFGPRKVVDGNPRAAAFGPTLEFWGSGSAVYRVPAEYTRLAGTVSLNPPGNRYSPCLVSVLLENKTIWERRLDNAGQPVEIDLPVQGDQRLTLLIQAQTAHPVGEIVSWHALRFVK